MRWGESKRSDERADECCLKWFKVGMAGLMEKILREWLWETEHDVIPGTRMRQRPVWRHRVGKRKSVIAVSHHGE
jgi:hypothetical protein